MHVSLAVVCLQVLTFLKFDITLDYNLLLFTFSSTLVAYNFIKYCEIALTIQLLKRKTLKLIYFLTIISVIICLLLLPKFSSQELIITFVVSSFTVLYALPVSSFNRNKKNLRSIPGLKIFIVATVWSLLIVFLPIIDCYDKINVIVFIYFIQIFIYVFVAILPFDIKDLNLDIKILNTVPQNIGIQSTKNLGFVLLFVFFLLDFLQILVSENVNSISVLINIVICITLSIFLYNSRENQPKYYALFWVESVPVFLLLLNIFL